MWPAPPATRRCRFASRRPSCQWLPAPADPCSLLSPQCPPPLPTTTTTHTHTHTTTTLPQFRPEVLVLPPMCPPPPPPPLLPPCRRFVRRCLFSPQCTPPPPASTLPQVRPEALFLSMNAAEIMEALRQRQVLLHGLGADVSSGRASGGCVGGTRRWAARVGCPLPPRLLNWAGISKPPVCLPPPAPRCSTSSMPHAPGPLPPRPPLQLHPDASRLNVSHVFHTLRFGPHFPGQVRSRRPGAAGCKLAVAASCGTWRELPRPIGSSRALLDAQRIMKSHELLPVATGQGETQRHPRWLPLLAPLRRTRGTVVAASAMLPFRPPVLPCPATSPGQPAGGCDANRWHVNRHRQVLHQSGTFVKVQGIDHERKPAAPAVTLSWRGCAVCSAACLPTGRRLLLRRLAGTHRLLLSVGAQDAHVPVLGAPRSGLPCTTMGACPCVCACACTHARRVSVHVHRDRECTCTVECACACVRACVCARVFNTAARLALHTCLSRPPF